MELIPDEITALLFPSKNYEEYYEKFIMPIYISNKIPENLLYEIDNVKKLLSHSYYEYSFIDLALLHASFVLEKAIRIKYEEIGEALKIKTFEKLIVWAFNKGLFETENIEVVHQIREIRNYKVHDHKINGFGGVAYFKKILNSISLINDLFEDPNLRKKRKTILKKLNSNLFSITKNGAIFQYGNTKKIIYGCLPLIVNNKIKPKTLSLIVYEIFNPKSFENNTEGYYIAPYVVPYEVICFKSTLKKFESTDIKGETILITKINKKDKSKYDLWKSEIEKLKNQNIFFEENIQINEYFHKFLKSLHES